MVKTKVKKTVWMGEVSYCRGDTSVTADDPSTPLIYQRETPFRGFGVQFRNLHIMNQNTLGVDPLLIHPLTTC